MPNPAEYVGKKAGLIPELVRNARLTWRLFRDPRVPNMTKLIIPGLAVAYVLLPVDLMPDVFPLVGQLDDLALIALGMKLFVDVCPTWLVQAHRNEMAGVRNTSTESQSRRKEQTVDADYRVID